jgi:hypothetical protein
VLGGLFLFVGFGMAENISNYVNTFFWGFTSEEIATFIPVIFLASFTVLALARRLVARLGKRGAAMLGAALPATLLPLAVSLRLFDVLPPNGHPALLQILRVNVFFVYSGLILAMAMVGAMIADVTDEHELSTGARQEGLLFSASAFLSKAASGAGLSCNNLQSLPDSIGNLHALQYLSLNNNQLISLPNSIGNLHALRHLRLFTNHLQFLPESMGNLNTLEKLYLCDNHLQSLPESIGNIHTMQELSLENNQLQSVPESRLLLPNLHYLSLQNNPRSSFTPVIVYSQLSHLRSRRNFLKCYFALALACSFPVIESVIINS